AGRGPCASGMRGRGRRPRGSEATSRDGTDLNRTRSEPASPWTRPGARSARRGEGRPLVLRTDPSMEIRTMASFLSPRRRGRRPSDRRRTAVRTEFRPLESRSLLSGYTQLNLVGYRPGMARRTDPDLNGWGLDFGPNGPFCVANTSTGVATFHDQQGNTASPPVTIPAAAGDPPGTPRSPP